MTNGPENLTYRITQLITGHGCFAEYLVRIRAINSEICAECETSKDNAAHTLFTCKKFENQREKMRIAIGGRITHETIIMAIANGGEESQAVHEFGEEVMKQKEEKERENEKVDPARQERKRRRNRAKRKLRQELKLR